MNRAELIDEFNLKADSLVKFGNIFIDNLEKSIKIVDCNKRVVYHKICKAEEFIDDIIDDIVRLRLDYEDKTGTTLARRDDRSVLYKKLDRVKDNLTKEDRTER